MTDSQPQPSSYKLCQHCGQEMDKGARTCPGCGKNAGANQAVTVIIVLAVLGALGFGSLVFVGIIAAIALPNFIGAQMKAKTATVKGNMLTCQIAAESYATDHGGAYPTSVEDQSFRSYFPGGQQPNIPGKAPINPFTLHPEWQIQGTITDVIAARSLTPSPIGKGVVEYSVIFNRKQQPVSYAIRGGGPTGQTIGGLQGQNTTLVLSNH